MERNHFIGYVAGIVCALVIVTHAARAGAGVTNFQVGSGNWSTDGNWNAGEPGSGDYASVGSPYASTATVTIDQRGEACYELRLGYFGTNHGEVNMVSGGLNTGYAYVGWHGEGVFTQSGGPHLVNNDLRVGCWTGSDGEYVLSGASTTLDVVGSVFVGDHGLGTFRQSGGTHEVGGDLRLADKSACPGGTYELHGGTLQVNGNITDGPGTSSLYINAEDALDFNGSTIDVDYLYIGTDYYTGGHETHAGESITCRQAFIALEGIGSLTLASGGSLHCTDTSYLGYALHDWGTLTIYDGSSLSADTDLYVGFIGSGVVHQYGGSATVGGGLYLARHSASSGRWAVKGGTLTVDGDLSLGGAWPSPGGDAHMTIETGGTVDVGETTYILPDGRLDIIGGTFRLDVADELVLAGGHFGFHVGTLELDMSTSLPDEFLTDVLGPARTLRDGQHLLCSGPAATLEAELVIDGGTFSARTLNNAGALRFERGRFNKLGGNLVAGSAGTFGPVLTVRDEQHYHAEGHVQIDSDGLIQMDGGELSSDGGILFVAGRLGGDGRVGAALHVSSGGEVRVEQGDTLEIYSQAACINAGQVFLAGGALTVAGVFTNEAEGDLFGRGTLITAGLTNDGDVAFSNDVTDVRGDVTNNGRIIISGRADVTFWDDVHNAGTLFKVAADSSATFFGELSGAGITGGGHVYAEADVTPGASPAVMAFGGDLSFGPLARLHTELGGTTAGSEFDQVNVAGGAALDGTLEILLIGGFQPEVADEFRILTFASRTGEFSAIEGWQAGGLALVPLYGAEELLLHATYVGDANLDHVVGIADLAALADNYGLTAGATWMRGDFNLDGQVGIADLAALADNYGKGAGGGIVPEPSCVVLLVLAVGAVAGRRRRCWAGSRR